MSNTSNDSSKKPHATLDLKATEIKAAASDAPRPAAASSYAEQSSSKSAGAAKPAGGSASAASSSRASEPSLAKKGGGFFSHLAAGIAGGVLSLAASQWALPHLGVTGTSPAIADSTAALEARLKAVEQSRTENANGAADAAIAETKLRLESLEKAVQSIPALSEAQTRFIAETKATLAAAAGDAGVPEQLERLSRLEAQFKALTDAGANDPNAGRIEQLAALTGKVADLETSLATQLTELRKSVGEDVNARLATAAEASEAAKSGTQRIDRDVAGVKSDAIRTTERLQAMKAENDRLNASVTIAREETAALRAALEAVKAQAAKPADVAASVAPIAEKLASVEKSLSDVLKSEVDRRSSAERIVLSLELQNLKRALDRGEPYSAELDNIRTAAAGKIDLAPLEQFKSDGVPSISQLAEDFRQTANAAIDADAEPAEGGVIERLIANAKSVVRVRKIDHGADDKGVEAVVGRMQTALKEGRLQDVLEESKALSPKALDAARPLLDRIAARVSVDAAVAALETQIKSSLSDTPATPK